MMKMRLEILAEDLRVVLDDLERKYTVLSVSKPYPNRNGNKFIRIYVEAKIDERIKGNEL